MRCLGVFGGISVDGWPGSGEDNKREHIVAQSREMSEAQYGPPATHKGLIRAPQSLCPLHLLRRRCGCQRPPHCLGVWNSPIRSATMGISGESSECSKRNPLRSFTISILFHLVFSRCVLFMAPSGTCRTVGSCVGYKEEPGRRLWGPAGRRNNLLGSNEPLSKLNSLSRGGKNGICVFVQRGGK